MLCVSGQARAGEIATVTVQQTGVCDQSSNRTVQVTVSP